MEWLAFQTVIAGILKTLPSSIKQDFTEESIKLEIDKHIIEYTLDDFLKNSISLGEEFNGYTLLSDKSYEIMLDDSSRNRMGIRYSRSIDFSVRDSEKGIEFSIGRASDKYILYLIMNEKIESVNFRYVPVMAFFNHEKGNPEIQFIDFLITGLRIQNTLKITSEKSIERNDFNNLSNALLFTLTYNTGRVFTAINSSVKAIEDYVGKHVLKRGELSTIESPKIYYKENLTSQYFKAMSATDPFISFLCFYHVIENFSEDIYIDDIIDSIRREIQNPKFSSKRGKDITKLIEIIRSRLRNNTDEYQINEQEAIELTLKKYIPNPAELAKEIKEIDHSSLNYYKLNTVPFSKGDQIDFDILPTEKLYKKLAARIYKTRNSIVHYKSNDLRLKERNVYETMNNEPDLFKELPLMQAIAELIIIATATSI